MYHAHNSYLQVLAEVGLVGLLLIVLFWAVALKALLGTLGNLPSGSFERAFTLGVIFSALAQLVVGVFDYNWGAPSIMLPLMFLMGLALAAGRGTPGEIA
ncbi:MAG: hypothetical protein HYZ81_11665 [Nitrospinae bacterium]|nr:hypothetical protein [Nitrospinota bacterium]